MRMPLNMLPMIIGTQIYLLYLYKSTNTNANGAAGLIVESQVAIERLEGFLGGFTSTKELLYSHKSTGLLLQKYLLTSTVQILTEYLVDFVEEAADEIDRKFC
jgi:hypothetical protein